MRVLTDAQGSKFEAAIAVVKLRGARPRKEDRRTIEAIIWRLDNGAKWRSIPAELGNWHHAYLGFGRWTVAGVWDRIMAHMVAWEPSWRLPASTRGASAPEGRRCAREQIDSSSLRLITTPTTISRLLAARGVVSAAKSLASAMRLATRRLCPGAGPGARACPLAAPAETFAKAPALPTSREQFGNRA